MKEKILTLTGAGLILGSLYLVSSSALAYRGDTSVQGPNFSPERHEAIKKAFESVDYNAWKNLMGDRPVVNKVTAENFAKFAQAHELAEAGDLAGAEALRKELGLGAGSKNRSGSQRSGSGNRMSGNCVNN